VLTKKILKDFLGALIVFDCVYGEDPMKKVRWVYWYRSNRRIYLPSDFLSCQSGRTRAVASRNKASADEFSAELILSWRLLIIFRLLIVMKWMLSISPHPMFIIMIW